MIVINSPAASKTQIALTTPVPSQIPEQVHPSATAASYPAWISPTQPTTPTLPQKTPCYPRGEGNHFQSRASHISASAYATHPIPRRPVLPASPSPTSLPPSQFGTSDFKTSTILQRQKRCMNAGGCVPPVGTTSPGPSYRVVPREPPLSTSTSTSMPYPYPPQLPLLIPAYPIVMEPRLVYWHAHPNAYPQIPTFIGPALPTQRDLSLMAPQSTQHGVHPDRKSEPGPEPGRTPSTEPPSPGPSYTSTGPPSLHAPSPAIPISNPTATATATATATPSENIRQALLTTQVEQFMGRVEASEQAREERERADHEETVAERHGSEEAGKKERSRKGGSREG